MDKNDILELEITGMTLQGAGIARFEGVPVFVPAACTGDRLCARIVKVKSNCAFGRIEEIIVPSPTREASGCQAFPRCGGCAFRHIGYEAELALKQRELTETLRRIGGVEVPIRPIVPAESPERYRNKALLPLCRLDGRIQAGFYAPHSHRVVPCEDCLLAPKSFSPLTRAVLAWAEEVGCSLYDEESGKGLLRQIYLRQNREGSEILVTLVVNSSGVPRADRLIQALRRQSAAVKGILLNHNTLPGNTVLGPRCTTLWGADRIAETLCGLRFELSPLSFFQVNPAQAEKLVGCAAAAAGAQEGDGKPVRLLDLYCGTGTIGLSVLRAFGGRGELLGVESAPQAVEDARRNAANNGFENARFVCADAVAFAARPPEGWRPDIILIDPPRKGCEAALLQHTAAMRPGRIVYISCDPATLARDLALLAGHGYAAREAAPVDMFPRTGHVETVVRLERDFEH